MTTLTCNTDQLIKEVAEHVAQDRIVQGTYGEITEDGFRGCFIGCLGHSSDPRVAVKRFGLTEPLLRIAESIFEALPPDEARRFFADFPAAVGTDGKDLSLVHWQFLASELRALPTVPADIQAAIDPVIAGIDLLANGQEWPEAAEAARAAARAAAGAAEAAETARAAGAAARAAAGAAEAAETARAAGAARAAAICRQRNLFLALIRNAPVVTQ